MTAGGPAGPFGSFVLSSAAWFCLPRRLLRHPQFGDRCLSFSGGEALGGCRLLSLCRWPVWVWLQRASACSRQRFGSVGRSRCSRLLGAAWLLNFLPLKPGGRRASCISQGREQDRFPMPVLVVVQSIVVGLACFVTQVGAALERGCCLASGAGEWLRGLLIFAPLPAAAVCAFTFPRTGRFSPLLALLLPLSRFATRTRSSGPCDIGSLFWIAGAQRRRERGIGTAGVSQSASLVPIAGNGLGVRRMARRFFARVLPKWFGDGSDVPLGLGVSPKLVNRACEVVVAIPVGLLCVWWSPAEKVRFAGFLGRPMPA